MNRNPPTKIIPIESMAITLRPMIVLFLFGSSILLPSAVPSARAGMKVYPCLVRAVSKSNPAELLEQGWILIENASNSLNLPFSPGMTRLSDVRLGAQSELHGSVNGQPGFILEGTASDGRFESAFAKGSIHCESPAREADVVYRFKPWSHWFLRDGGGILEKVRPDPHGNLCYEGDAFQVAKDAAADSEFSESDAKISTSGRVSFFKRERTCLRGRGHPDRWECLEWSNPSPAESFIDRCANHGSGSGLPEDDRS